MFVGKSRNRTRAGQPGKWVLPKPNRFGGCRTRFGRGDTETLEGDVRGLLNFLEMSDSISCDLGSGRNCARVDEVGGG